jgi:hypothetical protein
MVLLFFVFCELLREIKPVIMMNVHYFKRLCEMIVGWEMCQRVDCWGTQVFSWSLEMGLSKGIHGFAFW